MKKLLFSLSILFIISCQEDFYDVDNCDCYHYTETIVDGVLNYQIYIYDIRRISNYYNENGALVESDTVIFVTDDFCNSVYSFGIFSDTTITTNSIIVTNKDVICN